MPVPSRIQHEELLIWGVSAHRYLRPHIRDPDDNRSPCRRCRHYTTSQRIQRPTHICTQAPPWITVQPVFLHCNVHFYDSIRDVVKLTTPHTSVLRQLTRLTAAPSVSRLLNVEAITQALRSALCALGFSVRTPQCHRYYRELWQRLIGYHHSSRNGTA
jgi:hypothetical protein